MTYIIMDTNAWIYLSNGFDALSNKYNEEHTHLKMLRILKQRIQDHDTVILTNEIIKKEWLRNKLATKGLIKKLEKRKNTIEDNLKDLYSKLPNKQQIIQELIKEYKEKIDELISLNEKHINEVEDLLLNYTVEYAVTDSSRIAASHQAEKKLAPFTGDKSNSTADMLILLGGVEYIKKYCKKVFCGKAYYHNNYFVTSNYKDFSSPSDKRKIHEDITPFITETKTKYCIHLGELINTLSNSPIFSDLELADMEEYTPFEGEYDLCPFCNNSEFGYIHFNTPPVILRNERFPLYDKNQLRLDFDQSSIEELNIKSFEKIERGFCEFCNSEFIRCIDCGELVYIEHDEDNECENCSAIYRVTVKEKGSLFKDIEYTLLKEASLYDEKNDEEIEDE